MYFCHNGQKSWLGAVIITVLIFTSNFPHCSSHLASLLSSSRGVLPVQSQKQNSAAQSLTPIELSQITRVSRDPSLRSDDDDGGLSSRRNFLASSMHQTRYGPNRFSHSRHYELGPSNPNENENHGSYGKIHQSSQQGSTSNLDDDNDTGRDIIEEDEDNPTFTPFIGARALTNLNKFFAELQENLLAVQQERSGGNLEIGQPERRRETSESSISPDIVDGSAQDYDSSTDVKASALRWQPPASGIFRVAESSSLTSPSPISSSSSSGRGGGSRGRFPKLQNFFQPTSEDRRANNYNPAYLWTTMGLGKKR